MIDIKKIRVEVSNRHVHLSKEHINILFGEGYELSKHRDLSQQGQFSAHEKVVLINKDKKLENVRVLGPPRIQTQIEISRTDSIYLDLNAPLKMSGDLEGSAGITVLGPKGSIELDKGVIIPHRHLHLSDIEAEKIGLRDGQLVNIKISGGKETIFSNVIVRAGPEHRLSFHIDYDEGNACFFKEGIFGELISD